MRNISYKFHGKELEIMPRSGYLKNVSDEDIFNLITSKAIVDEILPDGKTRRLGLNNYVVKEDGTVEWVPIILIPDAVKVSEVTLANTSLYITKAIESDCVITLYNTESGDEIGEKSVEGDITTFTGLIENTRYDIEVSRQVTEEQGGGILRSPKLTVRTKETVVAPEPIKESEVVLTNNKITISKAIESDCTITLYNSGTDTEAGVKSVEGNITTITGLKGNTSYDIEVSRKAPDYQGGGILKSPKLTVRTKVTVVAPEPVIVDEVVLTNSKITITKTVEAGCDIVVCTKGTTEEVGKKSVAGNVTSVTGLTANTKYDIYVTRKAPDYQGGGTLRSTKLTVTTKETVVAPSAVLLDEVELTHESIVITKTIDEDCTMVVYNAGTETEAGQKSVAGNVTTITGLTASTKYDIYVTRKAPDYQGGGVLKSPKLTVTTTAAPEPDQSQEQAFVRKRR